jgi:hypothetical protein
VRIPSANTAGSCGQIMRRGESDGGWRPAEAIAAMTRSIWL